MKIEIDFGETVILSYLKFPNKLFKLCPKIEEFKDKQITKKLLKSMTQKEIDKRFCFWEQVNDTSLINDLFKFIGSNFNTREDECFICENRGISMLQLMRQMKFGIKASFLDLFLKHLAETLLVLSENGFIHNDVHIRNLVVCPTKDEYKERIVCLFTYFN